MVVIADLHCGSVYGITPPKEQRPPHRKRQEESWREYCRMTRNWAKPDILLVNGDMIEGNQSRQGGAELLTPDRTVQCDMAVEALKLWQAKKIYMTYGTPYHVGEKAEDYERSIAQRLGAVIEGRLYFTLEGLTFDVRHFIPTTVVPYGQATPVSRELTWDLVKEARGSAPHVDVVIRSHAHRYVYLEDGDRIAMITPGLQLIGGRFGSRQCSGEIWWGALRFQIHKGEIIRKDKDLCRLHANKPRVYKIG
jgi:hypothetical protein